MNYLLNLAIAFDQLLNAVFNGDPDETLSSRAYRMQQKGHKYWWWTASAINTIFFWQLDHCKQSYESELNRKLPRLEGYDAKDS